MNSRCTKLFCCLIVSLLGLETLYAQRTCGTDAYIRQQIEQHPELADVYAQNQRRIAEYVRTHGHQLRQTDTIYTIPVVVHVIYNNIADSISLAQVISQIEVLNEDFRKLNADTVNTPTIFKQYAADSRIEFCLASFDPSNNPTDGVTYTLTTVTNFNGDDMKFDATGGHDAWPADQYLNMWVTPLGGGLLGFASSIGGGGSPATDGVVITTSAFGRIGNLDPAFNLGRTATHEVGHWLGLRHVWGDANCGDDFIPDTPTQEGPNFGCPTYPNVTCNNGPLGGDMFMNYMDYSDDNCFTLFTLGQRAVMRATFAVGGNHRPLLSSYACVNPKFNDIGIDTITTPVAAVCGSNFTAQAILKNYGQNTINSAVITWVLDGVNVATIPWTGQLAPQQTTVVTYPFSGLSVGFHTLKAFTDGINGVAPDPNADNDSNEKQIEILDNTGLAVPYFENFEAAPALPAGFTVENPDAATSWELTSLAAFSGSQSMYVDNFNYNAIGQVDELIVPDVDLTTLNHPGLSFMLAYAKFGPNTGFSDTLEVWVSGNCGIDYTRLYKKYGNDLTTAPPVGAPFVPAKSQWRKEWIDLDNYASNTGVSIKFRHTTNYENNLYLDNINIVEIFALGNETTQNSLFLNAYPNPATDKLTVEAPVTGQIELSLIDITGRTVLTRSIRAVAGAPADLDISGLAAGVYTLRAEAGEASGTQRISIY